MRNISKFKTLSLTPEGGRRRTTDVEFSTLLLDLEGKQYIPSWQVIIKQFRIELFEYEKIASQLVLTLQHSFKQPSNVLEFSIDTFSYVILLVSLGPKFRNPIGECPL